MNSNVHELGVNLRTFRKRLGLTQEDFGQRFGFSPRQIQTYEHGAAAVPVELLLAVRAQGYPIEAVIGEAPSQGVLENARSFDLYHLAVRSFPGLVVLFDAEFRLLAVEGAETLAPTGWARDDVMGKTLGEVLTPQEYAEYAAHYRAVFRGETQQFLASEKMEEPRAGKVGSYCT